MARDATQIEELLFIVKLHSALSTIVHLALECKGLERGLHPFCHVSLDTTRKNPKGKFVYLVLEISCTLYIVAQVLSDELCRSSHSVTDASTGFALFTATLSFCIMAETGFQVRRNPRGFCKRRYTRDALSSNILLSFPIAVVVADISLLKRGVCGGGRLGACSDPHESSFGSRRGSD